MEHLANIPLMQCLACETPWWQVIVVSGINPRLDGLKSGSRPLNQCVITFCQLRRMKWSIKSPQLGVCYDRLFSTGRTQNEHFSFVLLQYENSLWSIMSFLTLNGALALPRQMAVKQVVFNYVLITLGISSPCDLNSKGDTFTKCL